jgi:NADH-quinone oxidoreductase subunit H
MNEFLTDYLYPLLQIVGKILTVTVPLILAMAYLTYAERKVLAAMQLRQGPMTVGPFGLLQPLADGIKLIAKETIIPSGANKIVFVIAPMITFALALVAWAVIPVSPDFVIADINVGVLYLFAISSLGVYGILMAGWASNSRYAFLGGLRSAAQMVSYEVSIGLVIITVILSVGSFRLTDIVMAERPWWMAIVLLPMLVIFFISALAETNRAPFDLPEGESELVGGYNVEYSAMTFGLFFLGEYMNMILMAAIMTILFLGGWLPPFGLEWVVLDWVPPFVWFVAKVCFVLFFFLWSRATLPRFRYDQLMRLGWKVFLPFSLFYVVFVAGLLLYTGNLLGVIE